MRRLVGGCRLWGGIVAVAGLMTCLGLSGCGDRPTPPAEPTRPTVAPAQVSITAETPTPDDSGASPLNTPHAVYDAEVIELGEDAPRGPVATGAATPEFDIIAMVNDKPITEREVRILAYKVLGLNRNLTPDTPEWFDEFRKIRRNILFTLIDLELIEQAALAENIQVADEEVEYVVQAVRAKFSSEAEFLETLRKEHVTLEQLRDAYRREIALERFKEIKFARDKYTVSESEARALYNERKALFSYPRRVGMQQLTFLISPDASPETAAQIAATARKLREEIAALAKEGRVDFAGIAEELKSKGVRVLALVDYVTIHVEDSDPVTMALRRQPIGEVSPVIEMSLPIEGVSYNALHIVQVTSHLEPFESALPGIEVSIKTEKAAADMKAWIEDLRSKADVRVTDSRYR